MTRPAISLHVGAHKTATSHLQRSLQKNRPALRAIGTRFLPTNRYRDDLAHLQGALRDGRALDSILDEVEPVILKSAQGMGRLILSDENTLGQLPRVAKEDRIYPWGRDRVARTLKVLGEFDVSLFVSIRNPATFLQSAYSESLLHGPFQGFQRFASPFSATALRWSRLLEELREVANGRAITVWRQEDYPGIKNKVVGALSGGEPPADFTFLDKRPRPGLSARALEQLGQWSEAGRDIRDEALIAHAAKLFPKGKDWPAPDYFDTATAAHLTRNYDEDCAKIAGMEHVRLL